jgi:hypothetical protein
MLDNACRRGYISHSRLHKAIRVTARAQHYRGRQNDAHYSHQLPIEPQRFSGAEFVRAQNIVFAPSAWQGCEFGQSLNHSQCSYVSARVFFTTPAPFLFLHSTRVLDLSAQGVVDDYRKDSQD